MKKIGIKILSNAGYGMDQVNSITLRELKELVDELFEEYDEDTEIITIDEGNRYGAKYGKLYSRIIEDEDDEDEEE
jgi:hypothetical protein